MISDTDVNGSSAHSARPDGRECFENSHITVFRPGCGGVAQQYQPKGRIKWAEDRTCCTSVTVPARYPQVEGAAAAAAQMLAPVEQQQSKGKQHSNLGRFN